jgi:hypothetical protein
MERWQKTTVHPQDTWKGDERWQGILRMPIERGQDVTAHPQDIHGKVTKDNGVSSGHIWKGDIRWQHILGMHMKRWWEMTACPQDTHRKMMWCPGLPFPSSPGTQTHLNCSAPSTTVLVPLFPL